MEHIVTAEPADARFAEFEKKEPNRFTRAALWLASHLLPVPETADDARAMSELHEASSVVPISEANADTLRIIARAQTEHGFLRLP